MVYGLVVFFVATQLYMCRVVCFVAITWLIIGAVTLFCGYYMVNGFF